MRRVFRLPGARLAQEIDEELAFHIDMRVERLVASGMDPDSARREALRHFGAIDPVRQSCLTLDEERERQMRRTNFLEELIQDVHYTLRTLRRNLGFTAVVVLTIGIGVGANTSIFTLLNALLLRKLPVHGPNSLVVVGNPVRVSGMSMGSPQAGLLSWPLYRDLVARNDVFTDMFATGRTGRIDVTLDGSTEAHRPRARYVSANYFDLLGVKPVHGRLLTAADDRSLGGSPVVAISHAYWMRRFNGGDVVGKTILANGARLTIVGVAPDGFTGEIVGESRDIWLPLSIQPVLTPNQKLYDDRGTSWILAVGRLRPGVTIDQARPRIAALLRRLLLDNDLPQPNGLGAQTIARTPVYVASAATGLSRVRATFGTPLITLMAGVGLLLLIVCANVANLLLARAVARGREMSVRLAIGAAHARLLRQLLTESLVLGLLGSAVGLFIASSGSKLLLRAASDGPNLIPLDARLDVRVLAFTIALSIVSVVLFGLAPAVRAARADVATMMRGAGRSVSGALGSRGRRLPLSALLIAAQVALSLMLLAGAGLLVRSLRGLDTMDVGLARNRLLVADVDLVRRGYDSARVATLAKDIAERLRRIPGVRAVTFSENGIFSGIESANSLQAEGFRATTSADTVAFYDQVGPGYVHGIGARLVAGRDLTENDAGAAPRVMLVNETFAKFYFKDSSPIGRHIYIGPVTWEIVGVIADTKDHDLRSEAVRRMYFPYLRPVGAPGALVFSIQSSGANPAALAPTVRQVIATADPLLPIDSTDPVSSLMRSSVRDARLVARVATGFGLIALLLASIGLYGVMTYAMARRTGEVGLRVALGAQRSQVVRMVLIDALRIVGVGIVIGLPLALFLVRLLKSQLYNVSPTDPVSIGVALTVLVASGIAAAWLPAARAARIQPTVALREE
jgi:predicted permease